MGGRGSGSGVNGGSGATKIPLASGGYIDLTGIPLKYGKNDTFVDKKFRAEIDRFEKAHRDEIKREYGLLLDKDGRVIDEPVGKNGEVVYNNKTWNKGYVSSHNHNRKEPGLLGATFSITDIDSHNDSPHVTMRAAAKEGTYSLTKQSNYKGDLLLQAYKSFHRKSATERGKNARELSRQYKNGEITYIQYSAGWDRENNAHWVRLHNFLLGNQGNYGYSYTLERRRK